jgi:hypothetical protein
MMMINYLLLMGLVTALLVAVYLALTRWLHTPLRPEANESTPKARRTRLPDLPHLVAGPRRRTGMLGGRSRSRIITSARLSSFTRTPVSRRRKS